MLNDKVGIHVIYANDVIKKANPNQSIKVIVDHINLLESVLIEISRLQHNEMGKGVLIAEELLVNITSK